MVGNLFLPPLPSVISLACVHRATLLGNKSACSLSLSLSHSLSSLSLSFCPSPNAFTLLISLWLKIYFAAQGEYKTIILYPKLMTERAYEFNF